MKRTPIFLFILFAVAAVTSSCNKPDDNNDDMTLPDLIASLNVTGTVNASYSFTNPENGGPNTEHALTCTHSSAISTLAITGLNSDYTYTLAFSMPGVQTGSYDLNSANYGHIDGSNSVGFPEVVSGTLTINSAQTLWTVGATSVYSISGSWSTELSDGENPPSTISFGGTFTDLAVTGS